MNRTLPDPREPVATAFWRCCAGCSAWLAHPHDQPQDARIYCAHCGRRNTASWAAFDPQPHPGRDQSVRRHSAPGEWCVLARDKDTLTLRRLGAPAAKTVIVHLSDVHPRTDSRQNP